MLKTHLSTHPDGFWHFPSRGSLAPTLEEVGVLWAHQFLVPTEGGPRAPPKVTALPVLLFCLHPPL